GSCSCISQVMSTPDPLHANGLPFVFSSFRLDSRIASDNAMKSIFKTGGPAQFQPDLAARDEFDVMPMYRDVMTYATG
ncbi:MAG: metalloendopeptidase-like rane protein, partial [Mycobacterium sp.]|nr:metalloendopeptidase-like rane protein [Mycobacterium sp.]